MLFRFCSTDAALQGKLFEMIGAFAELKRFSLCFLTDILWKIITKFGLLHLDPEKTEGFKGIAERFGRQLSPDCSSKPRSGSVGTIELSSIRSNPFFVHDKAFRSSASRLDDRDVKTEEREKNVLKCLNNRTTSPTKNSLRENSQPKVLVHQPSGEEDLNLEIELELKNDENKNSKYSEELLNWYGRDYPVSPGIKSLSLPRCIPPPPPSPRGHRQRLPTSPTLSRHNPTPVVYETSSLNRRNLAGIHVVKKSLSDRSPAREYSPNKSATLPANHKLSPNARHYIVTNKESKSISGSSSSPNSSPNVRRSKSLLSSPSLLRKSPTLLIKKTGSYKELGNNLDEKSAPENIVQRLNGHSNSSRSKHKSTLPLNGSSKHKRHASPTWKPVDREMMTNYEGYYQDESSDGEVSTTDGARVQHHKSFDSVVFDVLKVSPEDFASQLTRLDISIFREIQPEELSRCGWYKKDKLKTSPNVFQMTQRFNNTSFYVIHEILHAQTLKIRAEVLIHFIKIAKKLHDLNNIHSLMAIVSSLKSASIYRLSKTWALVNRHHKATFDRLALLMNENNNREILRKHMNAIRLPCIPYLGMYLADLMFIDSAHPDTGGLESRERKNKMNNILRIISEYQQSNYDHLREIPHIKTFLHSVKYIEELQKFLEEDNYKRSLKIEPNQSMTPRKEPKDENLLRVCHNDLPRRSLTPPSQHMFKPGHRKSQSLGREGNFTNSRPRTEPAKIHKRRSFYGRTKPRDYNSSNNENNQSKADTSGSLPRSTVNQPLVLTTSLLDDSIISPGATVAQTKNKNGSIGSSRSNSGSEFSDDTSWNGISTSEAKLELGRCIFEGCLKRKCVLKHGRKPPISSTTKYWVSLCDTQLVFYQAKSLRATDKHHFKRTPCKLASIHEWMVLYSEDPSKLDSFQLSNPNQGDIYRFQCESKEVALVWIRRLQEAIKGDSPPEKDLINLDDT